MVLLHVKKTDIHQFFFETTVTQSVDEITHTLSEIHNLRLKLERLIAAVNDLAQFGPLKPEESRGLTSEDPSGEAPKPPPSSPYYNEDPTGYRTGECVAPDLADVMRRTCQESEALLSKQQIQLKVPITIAQLQEAMNNIRGAVMIAHPAYHGLPDWEPAVEILQDREVLDGKAPSLDIIEAGKGSMWWAGKEMMTGQGKKLSDYIGRNEKTTVVIKLQKKGAGPPSREPVIDQQTYTSMLSFYHKKQEEAKKLEQDDDDAFMNSSWANPRALKNQLIGGGRDISWRPSR
eukprot:GILI01003915.1.p1 GENE.GILI01003915.1~~GILI01003915.1.p1  ORF type:complete len:290 (-),score=69.48 GILI01003915.1:49-918(-)